MIQKKTPDFLHLLLRDLTEMHMKKGFNELEARHMAQKLVDVTAKLSEKWNMPPEQIWDKDDYDD